MPKPSGNRRKIQVNAPIPQEAHETMKRLMARGHTQGEMLQLGIRVLAEWEFGEKGAPAQMQTKPTAVAEKVEE